MKQRIPCACGCGELAAPGKKWRQAHHLRKGRRHPATTHGMSRIGNPEYRSWRMMHGRCASSPYYTDRGITVCERWKSFDNFLADMGPRPSLAYSLDRINNDGNYEPSNCRWATMAEQNANRRIPKHTVWFTKDGLTMNLTDWAKHLGVKRGVFQNRRNKGWSLERTITTPVDPLKVARATRR